MRYSMTSLPRMAALLNAVKYLHTYDLRGDIVECGVWQGGSMILAAKTLMACGDTDRHLYLYDTFSGMPPPSEHDRHGEQTAESMLSQTPDRTGVWCYAALDDVRDNILATGYPPDRLHFVKGKVEDTIPSTMPDNIALLRLDTDWYTSTKHELEHLYPRLISKGVLIIDDYGYWDGARKAVDAFLAASNTPLYLHRIDTTGRLLIKPHVNASTPH
jgi:O-methyltransferase